MASRHVAVVGETLKLSAREYRRGRLVIRLLDREERLGVLVPNLETWSIAHYKAKKSEIVVSFPLSVSIGVPFTYQFHLRSATILGSLFSYRKRRNIVERLNSSR